MEEALDIKKYKQAKQLRGMIRRGDEWIKQLTWKISKIR